MSTEQKTTQVKGSAKIMVIVTTTQELKAGDVLLRFKAEASQDDIHGIGSISDRPVFGNCCYTGDSAHFYAMVFFFFFPAGSRVCLLMIDILYKVTAHACW